MAGNSTRRSRSTNSVAAAAYTPSGYGLLADKHAKVLLGAGVGILVLTVIFTCGGMGRSAAHKQERSTAKQDESAEATTVKRPLPDGVTEDQVPKWVPYRQVSGRVELEPWDSVDADTARDAYFRHDIMAPAEARSSDEFGGEETGWAEAGGDAATAGEGPQDNAVGGEPPGAATGQPGVEPSSPADTPMGGLDADTSAPSAEAESAG